MYFANKSKQEPNLCPNMTTQNAPTTQNNKWLLVTHLPKRRKLPFSLSKSPKEVWHAKSHICALWCHLERRMCINLYWKLTRRWRRHIQPASADPIGTCLHTGSTLKATRGLLKQSLPATAKSRCGPKHPL